MKVGVHGIKQSCKKQKGGSKDEEDCNVVVISVCVWFWVVDCGL
jgi:hypothetical protein